VSLPRPVLRLATVAGAALAVVGATAGVASAHVTVSSTDASPGGYGTVVFSVPDESDTASTTRVQIQIPDRTPLASVSVQPVPGWQITTTPHTLAQPLKDDDGTTIDQVVSVIDLTATGGGIAPGQFQQFALSVGPFPDGARTFTFNAVQTYSDGTQTSWIDPTIPGQPEPEHPAPVLQLTSSSSGSAAPAAAGSSSSSGSGSDALPLTLSVVALVLGVAGVVLGLRAGRRTVAP
jgi:uncharacterized protein YcnI